MEDAVAVEEEGKVEGGLEEDAVVAEVVEDVGEREEKEKLNPSVLFLKCSSLSI